MMQMMHAVVMLLTFDRQSGERLPNNTSFWDEGSPIRARGLKAFGPAPPPPHNNARPLLESADVSGILESFSGTNVWFGDLCCTELLELR